MSDGKFRAACPHCGYQSLLDVVMSGQQVCCFMCGQTFKAVAPPTVQGVRDSVSPGKGDGVGTREARPVGKEGWPGRAEQKAIDEANAEMLWGMRHQSTLRLFVLSMITLGIYVGHYIKRQTSVLNDYLDASQRISAGFVEVILVLSYMRIILSIVYILCAPTLLGEFVSDLADTTWTVLTLVWAFKARNRMNGLLWTSPGDGAWFSGLGTFVFAHLYFNYKVNTLSEQTPPPSNGTVGGNGFRGILRT